MIEHYADPLLVDGDGSATEREYGPWDAPGTLYYWHGPFSSFAVLPIACRLPISWLGETVLAATLEHWFQATKATNAEDFAWVLGARSARQAKQRGGPHGEDGRRIVLREDWETVKFAVMCRGQAIKFAHEPSRTLLLATGARPLAELSPYDREWGCLDRHRGTLTGQNLHGRSLMYARFELVNAAIRATTELTGASAPFLTTQAGYGVHATNRGQR